MRLRRLHAALLVVALVAIAGQALAQTPPAAAANSAREEAQQHFRTAVRLMQAGRNHDAAVELQAAARLHATWSVWFNLGVAQRAAGANAAAFHAFGRYLATDADHDPQRRRQAHAYLLELGRLIGHVELQIEPTNAIVTADDEAQLAGTPRLDLDPGRHVVVVSATGFAPRRYNVDVTAGATVPLRASLVAATPVAPPVPEAAPAPVAVAAPTEGFGHGARASIHLDVEPATATVQIDGQDVGNGSVFAEAEPGVHSIDVTAPGHRSWHTVIELPPGDYRARVRLTRASNVGLAVGLSIGGAALITGLIVGGYFLLR